MNLYYPKIARTMQLLNNCIVLLVIGGKMRKVKAMTLKEREERLAYWFVIPTFIIVFGLVIYPALFNIWISFHEVTLGNLGERGVPFVGLKNYIRVAKDFLFKDALKATIIYSLSGSIFSILLGLAASLLLNRKFRGRGLVRAIFLFSYIAPVVSVAFIWKWLLNPVNGVISWALMSSHIWSKPIAMLSQRGWAMLIVVLFQGWRYFPFAMLMILAQLQAIPDELYEAADIDGAGVTKKFFYITLPELRYVLGTLFLLRLMWTFNKFDDIYLLTSGAAGTKVLPVLTYEFSFGMNHFGLGSATSMFLFIILGIFMIFYIKYALEW